MQFLPACRFLSRLKKAVCTEVPHCFHYHRVCVLGLNRTYYGMDFWSDKNNGPVSCNVSFDFIWHIVISVFIHDEERYLCCLEIAIG